MASSLHSYEARVSIPNSQPPLRSSLAERREMGRWEMKISKGQMVVLWSVLAGMMVMVFVFGFHAGREQGLKVALEEAGEQAVRLPIAQPVPVVNPGEQGTAAAPTVGDSIQLALGQQSPPIQAPQAPASGKAGQNDEFNFSPEEKVKTGTELLAPAEPKTDTAPAPVAGLKEKPALEMFKGELGEPAVPGKKGRVLNDIEQKIPAAGLIIQDNRPSAKAETSAREAKQAKEAAEAKNAAAKAAEAKKAKDKETAKTSVAPKAATSGGGWYVQAAAGRTQKEASAYVTKLAKTGLPTVIEQADVSGRKYYRVLVGPYADRNAANIAKEKVSRSGVAQGIPFLKFVR